MQRMASAADNIFAQVEAVINKDWVKTSRKDLMQVLEEIEVLGVDEIRYQKGNHVVVGSLDQLVRIRDHFIGRESAVSPKILGSKNSENSVKSKALKNGSSKHRDENLHKPWNEFAASNDVSGKPVKNNISDDDMVVEHYPKNYAEEVNNRLDDDEFYFFGGSGNHQVPKELMVDNDIWDYIESKRREDLKELETNFAAKIVRTVDDSEILKISVKPDSDETATDVLDIMHESLVSLYQQMFSRCVIEKHEVPLKNEEGQLLLGYISKSFPDVFAKRCEYNDQYLFIGPRAVARQAREQFQMLSLRVRSGELHAKLPQKPRFGGKSEFVKQYERAHWNEENFEMERKKKYEGMSSDEDEVDHDVGVNIDNLDLRDAEERAFNTASPGFKSGAKLCNKEDNEGWIEDLTEKELEAEPKEAKTVTDFSDEAVGDTGLPLDKGPDQEFKKDETVAATSEKTAKSLEDFSEVSSEKKGPVSMFGGDFSWQGYLDNEAREEKDFEGENVGAKKLRKAEKFKKRTTDNVPKVRIVKQKVPSSAGDSGSSGASKAASEMNIRSDTARNKAMVYPFAKEPDVTLKSSKEQEEQELKEMFRKQKASSQRMPYDSPSSSENEEGAVGGEKKAFSGSEKNVSASSRKVKNDADDDIKRHEDGDMETDSAPEANVEENRGPGKQPKDGAFGCLVDKAFHLKGHDKSGTIEITISFEADLDDSKPSRLYKALNLKAFLPASGDGRETLRLMKDAFTARRLFIIQRSEGNEDDTIVPNGVDFKENPDQYPDPGYLPKVMEQLRRIAESS